MATFLTSRQGSNDDKFSILLHSSNTKQICERVVLRNQNIQRYIKRKCFSKPRFEGTCFGEAIYQAEKIMQKYPNDHFIVMFLTDGQDKDSYAINDQSLTASQRVAKLSKEYEQFSLHAIHFSAKKYSETLIKIAQAGGNHGVKDARIPEELGDFFISTVAAQTNVSLLVANSDQ